MVCCTADRMSYKPGFCKSIIPSEMEFPFYDPSLQWPQQYWPTTIPAGTSDPTNLNYPVFDAFWTETAPPYQDPKIPNIAAPITIRDAGHNLPDTASAATSQQSESQPRVGRRKKDTPVNKTPRRLLKEANRYNELLYDEYVLSFTPTEVTCGGCGSTIQLEKRGGAQYYVGMWKRHKAACKGIKAGIVSTWSWFPEASN